MCVRVCVVRACVRVCLFPLAGGAEHVSGGVRGTAGVEAGEREEDQRIVLSNCHHDDGHRTGWLPGRIGP